MQNIINEADKVRAAYHSAQANVNQEFSPEVIAACKKSSNARMERIANGETTVEMEEEVLMKIWMQLNNNLG